LFFGLIIEEIMYTPINSLGYLGSIVKVEMKDGQLYSGRLEAIKFDAVCVAGYNLLYSSIKYIEELHKCPK